MKSYSYLFTLTNDIRRRQLYPSHEQRSLVLAGSVILQKDLELGLLRGTSLDCDFVNLPLEEYEEIVLVNRILYLECQNEYLQQTCEHHVSFRHLCLLFLTRNASDPRASTNSG